MSGAGGPESCCARHGGSANGANFTCLVWHNFDTFFSKILKIAGCTVYPETRMVSASRLKVQLFAKWSVDLIGALTRARDRVSHSHVFSRYRQKASEKRGNGKTDRARALAHRSGRATTWWKAGPSAYSPIPCAFLDTPCSRRFWSNLEKSYEVPCNETPRTVNTRVSLWCAHTVSRAAAGHTI